MRIAAMAFAAAMVLSGTLPAHAGITPKEYADIGVTLPAKATVPLAAVVTDENGGRKTLRDLISRPTVLVFADYTCTTLCGPIIDFVGAALTQSGLSADQYRLIVIGLDPRDSKAAAERMRGQLGDDAALNGASTFATADQATVQQLTAAFGYRYAYDKDHDQFIHPGAAYVLQASGRVARVLTGLGLSGPDMRLALVEASQGRIGTLGDQVRLICSGFDPTRGAYNVMVSRLLAVTGIATILLLGGLIAMLMLLGRRRAA